MASTTAKRTAEESSRIQTTFEPNIGNMVITPSMYVAPRGVLISFGREFGSETHTRMPLTDQILNRSPTMIAYRGPGTAGNHPQGQIKPSSYASMQVSCTLCSDIALNNIELGSPRHLSVSGFRMHIFMYVYTFCL